MQVNGQVMLISSGEIRCSLFVGMLSFLIGSCTNIQYTSYAPQEQIDPLMGRQVSYSIDPSLYAESLDCILVLETKGKGKANNISVLAEAAERSLARHLREKVIRVVGPHQRAKLARQLVYNPDDVDDRQRFSRDIGCRGFARVTFLEASNAFFGIWSQRQIELEVSIFNDEKQPFWKASHVARRSDGGLPISLISAPFTVFRAAKFQHDQDHIPSMIDDGMRRIFVTFPDFR